LSEKNQLRVLIIEVILLTILTVDRDEFEEFWFSFPIPVLVAFVVCFFPLVFGAICLALDATPCKQSPVI
jgi:hypothetical protein